MRRTLFLFPSIVLLLPTASVAEVIQRVVVKVNGDIITLSEFEGRQIAALQNAGIASDKVEDYLRKNNARILQEAVDDLLIVQRADELEIKLRTDTVKDMIENIKKEQNIPTDEALREQLRKEGMTLDDLKRNIAHTILRRQVLQQDLQGKGTVTEAEARADYDAHKESYEKPATVHLQEIFVPSELPDARARANEIVAQVRGGADFAELARTSSKSVTAKAGGDLGNVVLRELSPAIQKASAPLKPGEISDPIPGPDGFRVVRLISRAEAGITPFDEVKNEIENRLLETSRLDAYNKYVTDLRKNANIEVKVKEVPLEVSRPVGPTTFLEPPVPEPGATKEGAAKAADQKGPTPAADEPEISTTTQESAEHVKPEAPEEKDDRAKL